MENAQVRARATAKRFDFLKKENRLATVSQLGGGMKIENLWYKEEKRDSNSSIRTITRLPSMVYNDVDLSLCFPLYIYYYIEFSQTCQVFNCEQIVNKILGARARTEVRFVIRL